MLQGFDFELDDLLSEASDEDAFADIDKEAGLDDEKAEKEDTPDDTDNPDDTGDEGEDNQDGEDPIDPVDTDTDDANSDENITDNEENNNQDNEQKDNKIDDSNIKKAKLLQKFNNLYSQLEDITNSLSNVNNSSIEKESQERLEKCASTLLHLKNILFDFVTVKFNEFGYEDNLYVYCQFVNSIKITSQIVKNAK